MIRHSDVSLMLFGSAARGEADAISDRDLLVVGSDWASVSSLSKMLDGTGWSCSRYTWGSLGRLLKSGTFFAEHLSREGQVLSDHDDRLAHALASVKTRGVYDREIAQAITLLGVLEKVPRADWGATWALDVLMVATRSLGYALLANRGIFVFSFRKVLDELVRVGLLRRSGRDKLIPLRCWKSLYRRRQNVATWSVARSAIDEVDKLARLGMHANTLSIEEFVDQADKYETDIGWYANARRLEALGRCVPQGIDAATLDRLYSPQAYGASLAALDYGYLYSSIKRRGYTLLN